MAKTSEGKAKVTLDSASFEKGAKAVINAANAMSSAVKAAFAAAGVAMLTALGAETIGAVVGSVKSVLTLGESMANAGKRAGIAAGQFYLFNAAVEKGLSLKTVAGLLGDNAAVLNRSASIFRDVSIKLWAIGEKIRGFWLGLMDRVAPVLSRILDGSLGASLVQAGEWFGQKIADTVAVIYQLAKDGNLWTTLKDGLAIAFVYAGERLTWLAKIGYEVLKFMVSKGISEALEMALKPLGAYVVSLGTSFGEALGNGFQVVWNDIKSDIELFILKIKKDFHFESTATPGDMGGGIGKGKFNAKGELQLPAPAKTPEFSTTPVSGSFKELGKFISESKFAESGDLTKLIEKFQSTIVAASAGYKANEGTNPTKTFENNTRQGAFGADSLTSIGGGGGVYLGLSVLDVNKAQLRELQEINRKITGGGGGGGVIRGVAGQGAAMGISRAQTTSPVTGVAFGAISAMVGGIPH